MQINDHIDIYNQNNIELMVTLKDESIDIICIDPPYLYLKGQKLERPFEEQLFFSEAKRLLTKDGFIILFGRGTSFYRWNTILEELGFVFKEEIIWNKSYCSSPLMNISRVHETISIFTKGNGTINKVKIPYLEMKAHDLDSVIGDVKRMKSILKNTKSLEAVLEFLENNKITNQSDKPHKYNTSAQISGLKTPDRSMAVMQAMKVGLNEKTIIRSDFYESETFTKFGVTGKRKDGDRCVKVMNGIMVGMNEKSVIKEIRDHYSAIHPTQKPVRLLERLLSLVIPKNKPRNEIIVADFFAGSMSCMEAVHNMEMQGIACEIDKEYFEAGKERLEKLLPVQKELFVA